MPMKSKSLTTTKARRGPKKMPPLHPGEMLREEFLIPMGLSGNALAMALRVPATRISEILKERRGITADMALRLARYFHMSPEFWMNLQAVYDLEVAEDTLGEEIEQGIKPAVLDRESGALPLKQAS